MTTSLLAAALTVSSALAGDLHTVSSDGSGDFLTLASAYAAAADGDFLYVTGPTLSEPVVIDTKGVTVINGGNNWYAESLTIQNVPADSQVVLRGVVLRHNAGFALRNCDGAVLLTELATDGLFATSPSGDLIEDCQAVSIKRSLIQPGYANGSSATQAGLRVARSNVLIDNCEIHGVHGLPGVSGGFCGSCCLDGTGGSVGLQARDFSHVRLQSSTLSGGYGGQSTHPNCVSGQSAPAYTIEPTATVTFLDVLVTSPVPSVGTPTLISDRARTFRLPSSVQAGSSFDTRAFGEHGDTVFLLAGSSMTFVPLGDVTGVLQVADSLGRRRLGSLPPGEQATFTFDSPQLAPGEVLGVPIQAAFLDSSGQIRLSPADFLEFRGPGVPNW